MSVLIKNLHIKNFKSVRDLSLECDRINIFIGKPNAGKSNILEAISLLGAGYSEERFMKGFIRYNSIFQLFNNFDIRKPVSLVVDDISVDLSKNYREETFHFSIEPTELKKRRNDAAEQGYDIGMEYLMNKDPREPFESYEEEFYATREDDEHDSLISQSRDVTLQPDGKIINQKRHGHNQSPVKKYEFKLQSGRKDSHSFFTPPHGGNFYQIVRSHQELREEIQHFLKPNGLELLLDEENKRVSILQREAASVISFPLHLVPDTFQRYIFHLAAIMSNRDSVLLFEEPESHSYAPYVYQLAQHILDDEGGNQYFITTHSPYFLLPLMQEGKDVAVFATWFEDYQTHARRLTEEEIREMLDYGVDVFLNLDHFTPA